MNQEYQKFFSEFFSSRTNKMKQVLAPTLQQATMVKIAIELWNQNDVRESIVNLKFDSGLALNWQEWRQIEENVLVKMAQLPLHELLKRELLSVVRPMGVEIKNWWVSNGMEINISKLPNQFVWTPEGTIDKKKTTMMLIKDEDFDHESRYKIACMHCMENEIPQLWNQIPKQQKLFYYNNKNLMRSNVQSPIRFWTCHLIDRPHPHAHAFVGSVIEGNMAATEFFFNKLSEQERNSNLVKCVKKVTHQRYETSKNEECYSEVFFYLLSKMSVDQQVQLLVEHPYSALFCFLDWPYQPFFTNFVKQIMFKKRFDNKYYMHFLISITKKIFYGRKDFDYQRIFIDVWQTSCLSNKRQAIETPVLFPFILLVLFQLGEKDIIESLFEHMNAFDREGFVLRKGILSQMVGEKRFGPVKFFLEMCEPTKEVLIEIKETFTRRKTIRWSEESEDESDCPEWHEFSQLLDELIAMKSERKRRKRC